MYVTLHDLRCSAIESPCNGGASGYGVRPSSSLKYVSIATANIETKSLPFTLSTGGLSTASTLATGELLISGYLTRWDELDREDDRMIRGSFAAAIPEFLKGRHRPFVYAHRIRDVLGTVLHLEEDHVGVKMVAKVNAQPSSSPLRWVYEAIKNRTITGLSVGARFRRRHRADGTRDIIGVDIVEASATAQPMLKTTGFEIISEGKAVEMWGRAPDHELSADDIDRARADVALLSAELAVAEANVAVVRALRQ